MAVRGGGAVAVSSSSPAVEQWVPPRSSALSDLKRLALKRAQVYPWAQGFRGAPKRQGSRKSVRLMKKRKSLNSSDFMDTADDTEVLPIGVINVDENDVHDPQLVSE